ncbi:MAG: 4-(cytidine 5'-diphospho)-2-C-methyl-D-erythritol kinase [Thermodesulfobacteriota bacterium]|nr:4-(cytidine 5'-diphospho)-2-C-methyl-D-erythritol kinase [Thermodesulfobacteriota bacterium]
MPSLTLNIRAPAKLNLYLSVVGRRPDGYHLLETLMVKLDLADSLVMTRREAGISLRVNGADLPSDKGNLVFQAAQAFFKASGFLPGVELTLEKRIPVAAGLGGGSSDAAAALKGLNELFGRPLNRERLAAIGLNLGADVPFFLYPGPAAWAKGIGERLHPASPPPLYFLLVNPGWPLSTAWVFNNFKLKLTNRRVNHINFTVNERSFTNGQGLRNDLETVVLPRFPELALIKKSLLEAGALGTLMTGSGPTVFGVFSGPRDLDLACGYMEKEGKEKWIVLPALPLSES